LDLQKEVKMQNALGRDDILLQVPFGARATSAVEIRRENAVIAKGQGLRACSVDLWSCVLAAVDRDRSCS